MGQYNDMLYRLKAGNAIKDEKEIHKVYTDACHKADGPVVFTIMDNGIPLNGIVPADKATSAQAGKVYAMQMALKMCGVKGEPMILVTPDEQVVSDVIKASEGTNNDELFLDLIEAAKGIDLQVQVENIPRGAMNTLDFPAESAEWWIRRTFGLSYSVYSAYKRFSDKEDWPLKPPTPTQGPEGPVRVFQGVKRKNTTCSQSNRIKRVG